jgi:metallo-beta-lactamase family protein
MVIKFLGAAGTVTGSKTLIESNGIRILIDCGMFQGIKPLRELNWEPLPVLPKDIDYVLLTHGHLDHCGWLPRLVREGFQGKIYCTGPTREISKLVLLDSAKIQEDEAETANKGHYSKHNPAEPLYTIRDAEAVFSHFGTVKPEDEVELDAEISARFFLSGHIIGACSIELKLEGKSLVFSGDIGRDNDELMFAPKKPTQADYIFMESTYGDKLHPKTDALFELETYINNAYNRGGTVIIPGFAVERAQTLMYLLWQLRKQERIPDVPYIVDSPMGINVLDVFFGNPKWHKLSADSLAKMAKMFTLISDYKDTIDAVYDDRPKVVIAASGMITGGRVLTYLERYITREETTVILVGYQAEGTRGRKLLEGANEIKIRGRYYPVKANILEIQALSAHADQGELIQWLSALEKKPSRVFLMHGENQPADTLRIKIAETYGMDVTVPMMGQKVEL